MGGKKKKGFGSLLKSVFVDTDNDYEEDELDEEYDEEEDDSPAPARARPKTESVEEAEEEVGEELNQDLVSSIKNAIDEANLEGYDYYEFIRAVNKQKFPSEKQKYEVVYSIVCDNGVTKKHLLTTADHYIEVLRNHKATFDAKVEAEELATVTQVKERADGIETTINDKLAQIEAITAEIETLGETREDLIISAQENSATLSGLRNEAITAYNMFGEQILDSKEKINKYISEE